MISKILAKIDSGQRLNSDEMCQLLEISSPEELESFRGCAYRIKRHYVGRKAYFRGIIESSNICEKNCYYCGIRRGNSALERFQMDKKEIVREALWAYKQEYGSLLIQSGERQNSTYIDMIESAVREIKRKTDNNLGITLSLGEQTESTLRRWREAGAHRYLLRIETTNPELYQSLHPQDHDLEVRKECLALLKKTGYQVGTGVMMGLPGQTIPDLVNDLLFMKEIDIDMIGMGPYIPHRDTPLGSELFPYSEQQKEDALLLGLKMIALARVIFKDINIAATTALQALNHTGREMGLQYGANVIMPNLTATKFRPNYKLYEDKPCLDENSSACRSCLANRVQGIGETIGFNEWGDSPHYFKRIGSLPDQAEI